MFALVTLMLMIGSGAIQIETQGPGSLTRAELTDFNDASDEKKVLMRREKKMKNTAELEAEGISLVASETAKREGRRERQWPTLSRSFVGASPVVSQTPCTTDAYTPSEFEQQWADNTPSWTADHCSHMREDDVNKWIDGNTAGPFDPKLFSTVCRRNKLPQFIEPLAGILRDPRVGCYDNWKKEFSLDWIVFPDSKVTTKNTKARFYDAGGSNFNSALRFFLKTYSSHGIVFDEVFVWEYQKQGIDSYWKGVDPEMRAFWEPRLTFYDGIPVSADKDAEHNPVSRIFKSCAPDDFCAMKLDIDTPSIELPLVQQFLHTPDETSAKLDEFFFEHHVHGVMQAHGWKNKVAGTFADSYKIFHDLRALGVRAHSWV